MPDDNNTAPQRRKRRFWAFLFGLPLLGLILLAVTAWVLLRTDFGLGQVERLANRLLTDVGGQRIVLAGLGGSLPFDLRLQGLELADANGTWLEADGLALRWSGRDLFSARLRIMDVGADRLTLHRLPIMDEEAAEPAAETGEFKLPESFPLIVVERLAVGRIVLGEAVAGERTVLTLAAALRSGPDGAGIDLDLETLEGPGGRLAARAGFEPVADVLTLDLDFNDPNGSLAPLLGLPLATPLILAVQGGGPPSSWSGRCAAQIGDLVDLKSDLVLGWQDIPRLDWQGMIRVGADLIPEQVRAYGPETDFSIQASLPLPNLVRLEEIRLENPMVQARASSDMDLDRGEVQGNMALEVLDTGPLNKSLGIDLGPAIALQVEAAGPLGGPDLDIDLALHDVRVDPLAVAEIGLHTAVGFGANNRGPMVSAVGQLRAGGPTVPDLGLPEDVRADFELEYSDSDQMVRLNDLHIHGPGLLIRGQGGLALADMTLEAGLALGPMEIIPWIEPQGLDFGGRVSLAAEVRGGLDPLNMEAVLQAAMDEPKGLPEEVSALIGQRIDLEGRVSISPPGPETGADQVVGRIRIEDLKVLAGDLHLEAMGDFSPGELGLDASVRLELADLSGLAPELSLGGRAILEATARGILDDFSLRVHLAGKDLLMTGLEAFPAEIDLKAEHFPARPTGTVSLAARPMQADVSLKSGFELDGETLGLSELVMALPGGRIEGFGRIDASTMLAQAKLTGRFDDLGPLAGLAGLDIGGRLDFDLGLRPVESVQAATLGLRLDDIRSEFGTLDELILEAEVRDLANMAARAVLEATGLASGEHRLEILQAEVSGTHDKLGLQASLRGRALRPFDLELAADYESSPSGHELGLKRFEGFWADQPFKLLEEASLRAAGGELELGSLGLEFGRSRIRAGGRIGETDSELHCRIDEFSLGLLSSDVQGLVSLEAILAGPNEAMEGRVGMEGRDLGPSVTDFDQAPLLKATMEAALDGRMLTVEALLAGNGAADSRLEIRAGLPLTLSLDPAGVEFPEGGSLDARILGNVSLGWLGPMFVPESQAVDGVIVMDCLVGGTLLDPVPAGTLALQGGRYQHFLQGILLDEITADVEFERGEIRLVFLSATDGDRGRLKGTGRVALVGEKDFPFQVLVTGESMRVLDSPMIRAGLKDLRLDLQGTTVAQEVRGSVLFEQVDVYLRDVGGPRVVDLPVAEAHDPDSVKIKGETVDTTPASSMTLDLDISFPARVFVRGRGLDSEWGGTLRVTGRADGPLVRGEIRPIRGRLDFLTKRFEIEPESVVQFTGSQPPVPFVNILAVQQGRDHVFTVQVTGSPPDVQIALRSVPAMPQDEVLSQMLFGRDLAQITPIQAARLALAARELAGGGSGLDIMDTARDLLLLDDLDIVSGRQGNDMSLRAGKYVNERVYLRLESDLTTGEERVSADVELTPKINLESTVGAKGGGLGLFWKHDY
ncbi:MAG: hypothetical protein EOM25_09530 [Deltaproteobacteria bacterium]|nr:hypothetical protein [Deltaproteobacteria bacterium]